MIERLLAAEDALRRDDLAVAERLFGQVADADARNAIALVGLAQVTLARGDGAAARALLVRALEIDPDEAAAKRLLAELDSPAPAPADAGDSSGASAPAPAETAEAPEAPAPVPVAVPEPARPTLLDRIRRWLGLSSGRD